MMNKEYIQTLDQDLGEKCRVALEKSFGFKIPTPKAVKNYRKLW